MLQKWIIINKLNKIIENLEVIDILPNYKDIENISLNMMNNIENQEKEKEKQQQKEKEKQKHKEKEKENQEKQKENQENQEKKKKKNWRNR